MDPINIGSLAVAVIAALSAWATSRAAGKAARDSTSIGGRLDAEKEAYERARAFDMDTIERQDREIAELRSENESLKAELRSVMQRLTRLERSVPKKLEEMLRDRLNEEPSGNN